METNEILDRARRDIQARRAAAERQKEQPWLWAFLGLTLTLIVGVLLLPGNTVAERLGVAVQGVCSQAHYLFIDEARLPLCARNTGIYAGFLGSLLYLLVLGRGRAGKLPPWPITLLVAAGVVVMGVDGTNSLLLDIGGLHLYEPRNELRLASGLLMGTALAVFLLFMLNLSLRANVRTDQPILRNWPEYLGALAANALLWAIVWYAPGVLLYPVAIFSVLGIVGVLFVTNVFLVGMITGLEGRVLRLQQLARPATIALLLTTSELGLLGWLRTVVERQA